jgi:hypothetical protein
MTSGSYAPELSDVTFCQEMLSPLDSRGLSLATVIHSNSTEIPDCALSDPIPATRSDSIAENMPIKPHVVPVPRPQFSSVNRDSQLQRMSESSVCDDDFEYFDKTSEKHENEAIIPKQHINIRKTVFNLLGRLIKLSSIFALDLWFLTFSSFNLSFFRYFIRQSGDMNTLMPLIVPFYSQTSGEKKKWKMRREEFFPPYKDICKDVQRSLMRRTCRILGFPSTHSTGYLSALILGVLNAFFLVISYLGLGHFLTANGRRRWVIVIRKYVIFTCVCCGIWTDEFFECMGLNRYVNPRDENYIGNLRNSYQSTTQFTFSLLLAGIVNTRAVLLQVDPYLTPVSLFAIGKKIMYF